MTILGNDVIRIAVKMKNDLNDDVVNVYHAFYSGLASETDAALLGAIHSWLLGVYELYEIYMSDSITFVTCEVYNVTQDYPVGETGLGTFNQGQQTGEPLTAQLAPLSVFGTTVKKSTGKKFWPITTDERVSDGNTLNSEIIDTLAIISGILLTDPVFGDGYLSMGNYRPLTGQFIIWKNFVVRPGLYTQRRRRLGAGS
jgi:hypothetical protein